MNLNGVRPAVAGAMFRKLGMGAGGVQKPDSEKQILIAKEA